MAGMGFGLYDSDDPFFCQFCGVHISSRAMYQKHLNSDHREHRALPFICSLCQKGFYSAPGLRHHLEAHKGRQFACKFCEARFQHKHHMKRHVEGVHKMRECPTCFNAIPLGYEYDKHIYSCSG